MRKIEAGDSGLIQFFLRFRGATRGCSQSVKHGSDPKGAPIITETTFNFDNMPLEQMRSVYDIMTKAREVAINAARDAAERED
jgi:hypothetical protein